MLLLGWLERHYDSASPAQRDAFAALLELPDPLLERFLLSAQHPLGADLGPGLAGNRAVDAAADGAALGERNLPAAGGSNF